MQSVTTHAIEVESKKGETDTLYRWKCSCGDAGQAWYRGPLTAVRTGSDHLAEAS